MKHNYFYFLWNKIALITFIAIFCMSTKAYSQWTGQWNGTTLTSLTDLFTNTHNGGGTDATKIPSIYSCNVVQDSTPGITSNSTLKFYFSKASTSTTENFNYGFAATPNGATVVFRIKAMPSYYELTHIEMKNAHYRLRVRLRQDHIKDDYSESEANRYTGIISQLVNWPASFNLLEDYQTIRISSGPISYSLYLNENPTPLYTAYLVNSPSTSNKNFWFGKSGSGSEIGAYYDWILWDEGGAFAPGQGAALPTTLPKDNCTRLSDVKVNGVSIPAFSRDTLVTYVGMAPGSPAPTVTATAAHQFLGETCTVTNATSVPGVATITAIAADGVTPNRTYSIQFLNKLSSDASLKSVKVGSDDPFTLAPGTTTYNLKVPSTAVTPRLITCVTNERYATAVVTNATTLPGTATVLVTAQDGLSTKTYTFNLSAASNTDATLTNIKMYLATIAGFNPATETYNVVLPYGTTTMPYITFTKSDSVASVVQTNPTALPGATTLLVTAANLSTTKTYTINYTVSTTGLQKLSADDVQIFSTPSSSVLSVQIPEGLLKGTVYVYNISGILQAQRVLDKTKVDVDIEHFSTGIYPIKIVATDGTTIMKKMVKR